MRLDVDCGRLAGSERGEKDWGESDSAPRICFFRWCRFVASVAEDMVGGCAERSVVWVEHWAVCEARCCLGGSEVKANVTLLACFQAC